MSIAITFILNFIKNKLLDFLKSKYFYIFLAVSIVIGIIIFTIFQLKNKDKKIDNLNKKIVSLESKNIFLEKDLTFKKAQIYIKQIFTNSDEIIEKQSEDKLSSNTIKALKSIIYDYNKSMEIR